jgi:hypothetical protein
VLVRLEQDGQISLPGKEVIEISGQQRAGREGGVADRPIGPERDQQPLPVDIGLGVLRYLDPHELVAGSQVDVPVPEVDAAADEVALEPLGRVVVAGHRHVIRLALKEDTRLGQRRAPVPFLHDPRVAGGGHRALAEVGPHQEPILAAPGDVGLRLR